MGRLNVTAIVVAAGCALASAAYAADLPYAPAQPAFAVGEFVSPWYVRGDVGYWFSTSKGDATSSYSDVAAVDAGIGFRAGRWRSDITTSYAFQPRANVSPLGTPDVTARINVFTTLVNGYFDIGNWHGLTPYVGGGIGFSYMRPIEFASVTLPPSLASNPGTFQLAWDVTAGVSYALTSNLLIDSSYRYLHAGSPKSDLPTFGTFDFGPMNFHEIRTGFRYLID